MSQKDAASACWGRWLMVGLVTIVAGALDGGFRGFVGTALPVAGALYFALIFVNRLDRH